MAITYKDISQLTQKSAVAGTEKIVVSDSNYITPRQLAGRITGLVGSNTEAMATQWVVATTNLASDGSHRFVFEVIGNSYDGDGPIHSVIQAVNTPSQSAFVSGWSKAVNLGKTMTFYVANVSGYITLYFQITHGVSVWVSCHSGANLDNRVTSVVLQDSAPSYTWRATATNTNLSGFLPLAGGTMTGAITMSNGITIQGTDSGGTARTMLSLGSGDKVWIAYGAASAGYDTVLSGNTISLRYGTSHTEGLNLDDSGNVQLAGVLRLANAKSVAIADSGGTNRSCVEFTSANNLLLGYGAAAGGYTTRVEGNEVQLRYGTSHTTGFTLNSSGNCTAVGSVTASSFVKSGGTSSQYLRADGSVGTITISSSDPTSSTGNNGDIWIKI